MILYFWNIKYQIDYMILNSHVLTFRWILPKNRPSNFAESWCNGSLSETIEIIFQASLFIMLNLWSRANVHPFAVSHIICCIINTFVILFVGTVYMTVSIIDTYIWWYYYRNIFTDLLQNIITIFVTQKRKINIEEMRDWW